MNKIEARYIEYPKTEENRDRFTIWTCAICQDGNPEAEGGTVAHNSAEGKKHPFHRYCALRWYETSSLCPCCKVKLDSGGLLSLSEKCVLAIRRMIEQCQWIYNPSHQFYLGGACALLGAVVNRGWMISIGMGLQAYTVYKILPSGQERVSAAREIERLATEMIADLNRHYPIRIKLSQLESIAVEHPIYRSEIARCMNARNHEDLLHGLKNTVKLAKEVIFSDRFIRFWGISSALAALYFARTISSEVPTRTPVSWTLLVIELLTHPDLFRPIP